jgi:hypothetical protein
MAILWTNVSGVHSEEGGKSKGVRAREEVQEQSFPKETQGQSIPRSIPYIYSNL